MGMSFDGISMIGISSDKGDTFRLCNILSRAGSISKRGDISLGFSSCLSFTESFGSFFGTD